MGVPASDVLRTPGRVLGGIVVATLPRRLWNDWEGRVHVRAMALPAALLVMFLGFGIGAPSFLAYAQQMGTTVGDAVMEAGHQVNSGQKPPEAGAYVWFAMMFALPAFLFFTPTGLLCTYLVGSGLARAICCAADDPRPDPILSTIDRVVRDRWFKRRVRRVESERHALEGAETPDLLLTGRALGQTEAAYVVVASRLKPEWEPGVFVVTEAGRFRVGARFDRSFPEGLRAVYPLLDVASVEVTRRAVSYALPPLSDYNRLTRRSTPASEPPSSE